MYINEHNPNAFTYIISIKNSKGTRSETRRFNDQKHYDNWYKLVESKGAKIIGLIPTKDSIEHVSNSIDRDMFIEIAKLEFNDSFLKSEGIQNYSIIRSEKADTHPSPYGDYIQFVAKDFIGYNIIMFKNNEFTKWSFDRIQRSFINYEKIEEYLTQSYQ